MRLIDADELRCKDMVDGMLDVFDVLEAPTIEAIPIEWISQWLLKNCYDENGHYIGEGYDTVEDMLEYWRKEQNER